MTQVDFYVLDEKAAGNRYTLVCRLSEKIYRQAESLEFCSVPLSYQMSLAHPGNMATCPLTISVYQTAGDEQHSYLAYRRPDMLGDASSAEQALSKLLRGIVEETLQ